MSFSLSEAFAHSFLLFPFYTTRHTLGEYSFIPGVTTDSLGLLSEPSLLTSASASPTVLGFALQEQDSHVIPPGDSHVTVTHHPQ